MENLLGFLSPVLISMLIFGLHGLLPGKWISGYIIKENSTEKVKYHLNGILVFILVIALWMILGLTDLVAFDWLYKQRWYSLAGACVFGLVFSLVVVLPYPRVRTMFLADLFFGRKKNMQILKGRVDVKMCLYLVGAIILELNVLSFTYHHWAKFGSESSVNMVVTAFLLTYFVLDYLSNESVHLYTYDIFAERVGFKLGWGCLVFYPFFYAIPLWTIADQPRSDSPVWLLVLYVLIFLLGWSLARGANMQKYYFKRFPDRSFLGIKPQILSDGNHQLLVSGFWGMSRHINYLGEILMATGIALSTGFPMLILPWFYPLYYVLLLVTRQLDDDKRCSLKYGSLWNQYKKKVPYRIIPFIY